MKKTLLLLGLLFVANGMSHSLFGQNDGEPIVLEYKDYKFFNDEPDYKLLEKQVAWAGFACKDLTPKLYALDEDKQTVIEYDLKDALNKNIKIRTFRLSAKVEALPIRKESNMKISPNGQRLAFVDEGGRNLHVVDVSTGSEIALCKLGDDFDNIEYDPLGRHQFDFDGYGHPFAFLSDNEVLLSGASKAMIYNIDRKRSSKLTFDKKWNTIPKSTVSSNGAISGMLFKHNSKGFEIDHIWVTFFVENGKIKNTIEGLQVSDFPSYTIYWYSNWYSIDKMNGHGETYSRRTGEKMPSGAYLYSDNKAYYIDGFKDLRFVNLQGNASKYTARQQEILKKYTLRFSNYSGQGWHWKGWIQDDQILGFFNGEKLVLFNHTLTDNEIAKQALLSAIDEENIDALNQYIADFEDSRYVTIAKQKKAEWQPDNKSTSDEVNLTDGLVAFFPFENEIGGWTHDVSCEGNKADVYDVKWNPTTHETGYKGLCYHFPNPKLRQNGEYKSQPNHLRVSDNKSLRFDDAVSFSFWFKLEDNGQGQYYGMDDKGNTVLNSGRVRFFCRNCEKEALHAGIDFDKRRIEVYNNNESCSAPFQPNSEWNHLVLVVTKNYFTIYLNGKEVAARSKNMDFTDSNPPHYLMIGCITKGMDGKYPFHGWIDEFLIYNRELTGAEVKELFRGNEPDKDYLSFKKAKKAPLKDAVAYLKNCTNDNYRTGVECEIVDNKVNNVSDIAYCIENYPDLANRLEEKMYRFIGSVSDCETYLKCYPSSKRRSAIDDMMYKFVKSSEDVNDCKTYLALFPKGKHKSEVNARKRDIESSANVNTIMNYVKSLNAVDYNDKHESYYITYKNGSEAKIDQLYYVTYLDGRNGVIVFTSDGKWLFSQKLDTYFVEANPNTKSGALLNLYWLLH